MNNYEFVFILDQDSKEKLLKIDSLITSFGGKVTKSDSLGKKQFTYKLKNLLSGYYYDWNISIEKKMIKSLTQKLDLENIVLRYLIIKL